MLLLLLLLVLDKTNGLNLALLAAEAQGQPWSAEVVFRLKRDENLDTQERSLSLR